MDFREDDAASKLVQIGASATVSFVLFFFVFPNHPVKGGAICVCAIGGFMAARAFWEHRRRSWFWVTLTAVFLVQAAIISGVAVPEVRYPGIMLVPVGLADYGCVYGLLRLMQRLKSA